MAGTQLRQNRFGRNLIGIWWRDHTEWQAEKWSLERSCYSYPLYTCMDYGIYNLFSAGKF